MQNFFRAVALTGALLAVAACARTVDGVPPDAVDLAKAETSIKPETERVYRGEDAVPLFEASAPALRALGYEITLQDATFGVVRGERRMEADVVSEYVEGALTAILIGPSAPPPSYEKERKLSLVFEPLPDGRLAMRQRLEYREFTDDGSTTLAGQIAGGDVFVDTFEAIEALAGVTPLSAPVPDEEAPQ